VFTAISSAPRKTSRRKKQRNRPVLNTTPPLTRKNAGEVMVENGGEVNSINKLKRYGKKYFYLNSLSIN
jgi:hypothetical protein